jgi:hypothetical protein
VGQSKQILWFSFARHDPGMFRSGSRDSSKKIVRVKIHDPYKHRGIVLALYQPPLSFTVFYCEYSNIRLRTPFRLLELSCSCYSSSSCGLTFDPSLFNLFPAMAASKEDNHSSGMFATGFKYLNFRAMDQMINSSGEQTAKSMARKMPNFLPTEMPQPLLKWKPQMGSKMVKLSFS